MSLFAGLGYTPGLDQGDPTGLTFACGLRGHTAGERHRAFLEGSISQVLIETGLFGGFTFMASVGVGCAPADALALNRGH
jgi:hypothetical protein